MDQPSFSFKPSELAFMAQSFSPTNGWGRYSYELSKRVGMSEEICLTTSDRLLRRPLVHWKEWPRLRKFFHHKKLVHVLSEPLFPLAALLKRRNQKLVLTIHGTYSTLGLFSKLAPLYRLAYKRADAIVSVSQYTKTHLCQSLPSIANKIHVISLGGNIKLPFEVLPNRSQREQSFLMVGQVKPRKGTIEAILAMEEVLRHFPETRLYIIGDLVFDSYVTMAKKMIQEKKMEKNVFFLGDLPEMELEKYYQKCIGLVAPSKNEGGHFEGFGIIHLEANSFGLPTIGSYNCGNEEAIKNGHNGFLVEQGNYRDVAKKMLNLIEMKDKWDKLSWEAYQWATEHTWDHTALGHKQIYEKVLGNRK